MSMPWRVTATTCVPRRRCGIMGGVFASGRGTALPVQGRLDTLRDRGPASHLLLERGSFAVDQVAPGGDRRTCPHWSTAAPTEEPASNMREPASPHKR